MSIKMLKVQDSRHHIYLSSPAEKNPVFQHGATQEITDSEYIKRWVDYIRSKA